MNTKILYHWSKYIIDKPTLRGGKKTNDYEYGFYCKKRILYMSFNKKDD